MAGIGAALPPHLLAKRKRTQEGEEDSRTNSPRPAIGPTPPSNSDAPAPTADEKANDDKRRRVVGPAMPPAPLEEMPREDARTSQPTQDADSDSSSDDDDFGPAAPGQDSQPAPTTSTFTSALPNTTAPDAASPPKLQRDEWMTMAPEQDGLASRMMDPSRPRARGFNTGKSARTSASQKDADGSAWYETPEQKQKRLRDEMMGVAKPLSEGRKTDNLPASLTKDKKMEKNRHLKEQLEKHRGPSLMDQHTHATAPEERDDDPSKRAFDREKDMGSGARISASQRREMLSKASNFSSRFAGGSYL